MNQSNSEFTPEQLAKQRQGRIIMVAIVAVFILPFFIAPMLSSPDQLNKTNKGTFVQPHVQVSDLLLEKQDGTQLVISDLDKKWTMLYVLPENCQAECGKARDHALYAMRQVRRSLDRNMGRAQQILVQTKELDKPLAELLQQEFESMRVVRADRDRVTAALLSKIEAVGPAGNIFLMSPDGYIFMSYLTYAEEQDSILHARDVRYDLRKSIKGDRNF